MKELKAREYLSALQKRLEEKRLPQQATLELTYRCNFNCIHCYQGEHCRSNSNKFGKELKSSQWKYILDELSEMGILEVVFTGGEIFLRKDALDILIYARKNGFWVSILTNGSLLTEGIIDKLVHFNIRKIEASFNGASKETFEKITGVEGSYKKVLKNLKLMRKKGLIPFIKPCLLKNNSQEILRIMDFAKKEGFSFRHWQEIIPRLDGDQFPTSLRPSPEEYLKMESVITKRVQEFISAGFKEYGSQTEPCHHRKLNKPPPAELYNINLKSERLFDCQAGFSMLCINPFGKMNVCSLLSFPMYNILRGNVKEGWEVVKKSVDNSRKPRNYKCDKCSLSQICQPCPAKRYLETGDMAGCVDYWAQVAKIEKEKAVV